MPRLPTIAKTLFCSTSCCTCRHRLRRVVGVVEDGEVDLAAVDPAVVVHVGVVRRLGRRDRLVHRRDARERERAADVIDVFVIPGSDRCAPAAALAARPATAAAAAERPRAPLPFIRIRPSYPMCGPDSANREVPSMTLLGSDLIENLESRFKPSRPARRRESGGGARRRRCGSRSMTSDRPSGRRRRPARGWSRSAGTSLEIVGRSPTNAAPTRTPQSEPSPATAAPTRIWSESMTPNSFGWAKPFVPSTKREPGDAGEGGRDAERERLVDGQLDAGRRRRHLAVADRPERAAGAAAQHEPRDARTGSPRDVQLVTVQPGVADRLRRLDAVAAAEELRELQRQLRHGDREREGREREVDAGEAERRQPDEQAADEADRRTPSASSAIEVRVVVARHDRGRVAADGHEGAVADRDLARVPGEDVEAEDRDEEDARPARRAPGGSRSARTGSSASTTRRGGRHRSEGGGARPHTLRTCRWPNRPVGFTRSTASRTANANGSRSSEVTKWTYWPTRLRKTPSARPPIDRARRALEPAEDGGGERVEQDRLHQRRLQDVLRRLGHQPRDGAEHGGESPADGEHPVRRGRRRALPPRAAAPRPASPSPSFVSWKSSQSSDHGDDRDDEGPDVLPRERRRRPTW